LSKDNVLIPDCQMFIDRLWLIFKIVIC